MKVRKMLMLCFLFVLYMTCSVKAADAVSVQEGIYFFNVEADNHFVMNVNGNFTEEGTNIDIAQNKNADCQKFKVTALEDGYYRITSVSSGLDLTIADDSSEKEANLQLNSWAEKDSQKWKFLYAAEERYNIQSALGTYIDNYGGNLTEENNVWMYEANGSATQMWMLTAAEETGAAEGGTEEVMADTVESFEGTPGSEVEIQDGVYCINVESDNTYVLDVNGNYTEDGATIDIMPNVNVDCQKFKIEKQDDGYYTITAMNSGKVLTVANGSSDPETDLQQSTYDGSNGQKWKFIYVDENRVKIQSALGTYVDNYGGNVADANNVWMYGESDSASQIWMLTKVIVEEVAAEITEPADKPLTLEGNKGESTEIADGVYCINVEADNSYVLDVNGNYTDDGATIDIMPNVNVDCQKFKIEKQDDGYYTITAMNSGKVLTVADDSADPETDLQQKTYDGSNDQKWKFIYVDENRVKIQSALGTYIDNYGGNVADANNVWMYGESDSASQMWMLTPVINVSESGETEAKVSDLMMNAVSYEDYEVIPDGDYYLVSAENEDLCVTVADMSNENGADIQMAQYEANDYQHFTVTNQGDNTYSMICVGSQKSLDIDGGSMEAGANVQQWDFDGTGGQIWSFNPEDGKSVSIASKLGTVIGQEADSLKMASDAPVKIKLIPAK